MDPENRSFDQDITLGSSVVLPASVFQRMAACYYGFGPRGWETPENRQYITPVTTGVPFNSPLAPTAPPVPGKPERPDPEIAGPSLAMIQREIPASWIARGTARQPDTKGKAKP